MWTGNTIVFLGKRRKLELQLGSFSKMEIEENRIVLQLKSMTEECLRKTFEEQAVKVLQELCQQLKVRYDQMFDDYRLDYVLLHEYVHLIVPNHSERFYRIIEMRMPKYREIQKILRES